MKGIVAAGHQVTAEAALFALRQGGNAFDAVLAALMASTVAEPILSSLGGGGYLMALQKEQDIPVLYDFFAQTPLQKVPPKKADFFPIDVDFGTARQEFHIGRASTAVPGILPGFFAVHEALCTLPVQDILQPALTAAKEGVHMTRFQAYVLGLVAPIVQNSEKVKQLFAPRGHLLQTGDVFRNGELAGTFEYLAQVGKKACVTGALVDDFTSDFLTQQDFSAYRVERRVPLVLEIGNAAADLFLNPSPSVGGTLIGFGMALLEYRQKAGLNPQKWADLPEMAFLLEQTLKIRSRVGEETAKTLQKLAHEFVSGEQGHKRVTRGTTHISVIDAAGNAASMTLSNGEGNGYLAGRSGVMLNNMLGEEDLHGEGFHNWRENSRLASIMAPTLIKGKEGVLTAMGSGGSNRIRSAILQVINHYQLRGMPLDRAVNASRMHIEKCGKMSFELGQADHFFAADEIDRLVRLYPHMEKWEDPSLFFGGVHCVTRRADGSFEGVGDARRAGVCLQV